MLVIAGRTTTMSSAALEKKVISMTAAQARKATIIITINGVTREGSAASYRAFAINAARNRAMANIRTAVPSFESYNADNLPHNANDPDAATSTTDSGYSGMTIALLTRTYDQNLPHDHIKLVRASRSSYCAQSTVYGQTAFKNGPAANITLGRC